MTLLAQESDFISTLSFDSPLFVIIIVGMAMLVAVIAIIAGTASSSLKTKEREQTRREIAAYVAEGTVDPRTAIELMKADPDGDWAQMKGAIDNLGVSIGNAVRA